MKYLTTLLLAWGLAAAAPVPQARAAGPWETLTDQDLDAIHALIEANHPGPVDARNPQFRVRLEQGLQAARAQARSAANFADYKRILQGYTNSFRDGHLTIHMLADTVSVEWPGFLPRLDPSGAVSVGLSEVDDVKVGDRILACDETPVEAIFDRWVAPYYWNRDIPHERALQMARALLIDEADEARRMTSCDLSRDGVVRHVPLEWRTASRADAPQLRIHAAGVFIPKLGLRQLNGVWVLSLPNFWYPSSQAVDVFKAVIADVEAHKEVLRNAGKVVIDLRGNTGGMSAWGEQMAAALWGRDFVDPIISSFDDSVDWRASPSNLKHIDELLVRVRRDGLASSVADLQRVRDAMAAALAAGRPLARVEDPGHALVLPATSPMKAHVYVLTDGICASACLDYMDVVLKLPGVTHVGLPTSADALYIDIDSARLPSGLARLAYSMKVFRKRGRANNQWYEPQIRWPGGPMTDEAVGQWIATLP